MPVFEVIKARIMGGQRFNLTCDQDDAFYVGDMNAVIRQHELFVSNLPRVEPFYAVKCNPDAMVLKTLNALGTSFDCASVGEMQLILSMGVSPSRIIYANPCKQTSHLKFAAKNGIKMLTFDNADELAKIKNFHPGAELVLRILADDSRSLCKLGLKFGATICAVRELLSEAKVSGLNVIGVSFHVGSGCFDASAFSDAVVRAKQAFDIGAELGFKFTLLDIGGGFPGAMSTDLTFDKIVTVLKPALDMHFSDSIRIIAEPGRFYVAAAFTLCCNITSRRTLPDPESSQKLHMYYINDGTYGAFNCIAHDHYTPTIEVLVRSGVYVYVPIPNADIASDEVMYKSSIWGPTCDSIDVIGQGLLLPDLNVGDWVVCKNMGAYTMAASSSFNGFGNSPSIYTYAEEC